MSVVLMLENASNIQKYIVKKKWMPLNLNID